MKRKLIGSLFAFVSFIILLLLYLCFKYNSTEYIFFKENYLAFIDAQASVSNDSQFCSLPIDIHPFDSTISPFLETLPKQVQCSDETTFQPLTYIDGITGRLRQNDTTCKCYYQTIQKESNNDANIKYGPKTFLDPVNGLELTQLENYIAVTCNKNNYENVHFWFNVNSSTTTKSQTKSQKPSVIILVIESLSRLNYLRYLNQTRTALEDNLGNIFYLEGLNKMADNSFPNMIPLLTGRRLYSGELSGSENYGPYDDWPLIWKNYSQAGYLTSLHEDYPEFTLFNYKSNGFVRSAPTNFYPRPYWMHVFQVASKLMSSLAPFNISPCYKDRVPKVEMFLDQLERMLQQANKAVRPLFAFSFYIELTHNNFNKAQTIDSHIAKFLERSAKYLNNSVLVLMVSPGFVVKSMSRLHI